MISIITAVHNGLVVNKIFLAALKKYTHYPFELIIIDNASTDGSGNYFINNGAKVIRNELNYSYPHSQNQGIAEVKYDWIAFLNNDVIVCPDWDKILIESMQYHKLDVATCCGNDRLETVKATHTIGRRWKPIKNFI